MRFQLVLIKPAGFHFAEALREPMEVVEEALKALGHHARIQINRIDAEEIPIIFGAQHIAPGDVDRLPGNSIAFNFEQLSQGYPWFSGAYLKTLTRFRVWDFSAQNVAYLHASGIAPSALHVPFGYSPCLTRIETSQPPDIDVLFFGVPSERRMRVLRELGQRGLNVVALNNVWGIERDAWIARAKIVLNIHHADNGQFEIVRMLFLLANGKAVVSEVNPGEEVNARLTGRYFAAPYGELVSACLDLLENEDALQAHASAASSIVDDDSLRVLPSIEQALATLSPESGN